MILRCFWGKWGDTVWLYGNSMVVESYLVTLHGYRVAAPHFAGTKI